MDFKICKNNNASEFVWTKGAKPFSKPRGNHAVFSWSQHYGPLVVVFTLKVHFILEFSYCFYVVDVGQYRKSKYKPSWNEYMLNVSYLALN